MAVTLADLAVVITGENKGLKQSLAQSKSMVGNWSTGISGTLKSVVGGAFIALGTSIAVGVGATLKEAFDLRSETKQLEKDLKASLGLSEDMMRKYSDSITSLFTQNYGASLTNAGEVFISAVNNFGKELESLDLEKISRLAFNVSDAFKLDIDSVMSEAATLVKAFGIDYTKAFDLIAIANQRGLNRAGDLGDTIEEYTVHFANGKASAEEMFAYLESGSQGGMLGLDKAADLFKEFTLRITDGSNSSMEALSILFNGSTEGIQEFLNSISSGSITQIEAFDIIQDQLSKVSDIATRDTLGIALMGTQYEDLTRSVVENMGAIQTEAYQNIDGTATALEARYDTFGGYISTKWREVLVGTQPLFKKLEQYWSDLWGGSTDTIDDVVAYYTDTFIPGLISGMESIEDAWNNVTQDFKQINEMSWQDIIDYIKAIDWYSYLMLIVEALEPVGAWLLAAWQDLFKRITDYLSDIDWYDVGYQAMTKILNGLSMIVSAVKSLFKNVTKAITEVDWLSAGNDIAVAIATGIKNGAINITDALLSAGRGAYDAFIDWWQGKTKDTSTSDNTQRRSENSVTGTGIVEAEALSRTTIPAKTLSTVTNTINVVINVAAGQASTGEALSRSLLTGLRTQGVNI